MFRDRLRNFLDKVLAPFDLIIRQKSSTNILTPFKGISSIQNKKEGSFLIRLDFPPSSICKPRWGWGERRHDILYNLVKSNRDLYIDYFQRAFKYIDKFEEIEVFPKKNDFSPYWSSLNFPFYDSVSLYTMIAEFKPATYLEIGSGTSTKFARSAVDRHSKDTKIISIDPKPREEINRICDKVIKSTLEETPLDIFTGLKENDILFFDGSHMTFMNGDVTVFILDILPRLQPGVIVQVHDLYIPDDYIESVGLRWYNEQYMLMAYLLGGAWNIEIILPVYYIYSGLDPELAAMAGQLLDKLKPMWSDEDAKSVYPWGLSFWMRIKQP